MCLESLEMEMMTEQYIGTIDELEETDDGMFVRFDAIPSDQAGAAWEDVTSHLFEGEINAAFWGGKASELDFGVTYKLTVKPGANEVTDWSDISDVLDVERA